MHKKKEKKEKAITNIKLDFIFMIHETINKASNTVKSDPDVFRLQVYLQYITKGGKKKSVRVLILKLACCGGTHNDK